MLTMPSSGHWPAGDTPAAPPDHVPAAAAAATVCAALPPTASELRAKDGRSGCAAGTATIAGGILSPKTRDGAGSAACLTGDAAAARGGAPLEAAAGAAADAGGTAGDGAARAGAPVPRRTTSVSPLLRHSADSCADAGSAGSCRARATWAQIDAGWGTWAPGRAREQPASRVEHSARTFGEKGAGTCLAHPSFKTSILVAFLRANSPVWAGAGSQTAAPAARSEHPSAAPAPPGSRAGKHRRSNLQKGAHASSAARCMGRLSVRVTRQSRRQRRRWAPMPCACGSLLCRLSFRQRRCDSSIMLTGERYLPVRATHANVHADLDLAR